jgi:protein TonB
MPPPKPAFNPRILVIGGAFACLLAGAGIVYYAGYRGKTAEPTDPAVSTAIASAPELNAPVTPPAAAETPASRPEGSRSDHAPAVSRGASAAAAGRPDAGRTTKAAPPAETSKPAAAEPQPAAATTNPPPVTGAPPSLPDPASTLVVSVSDVPAGNPPGRTGDSTTLPPVQATLPQASSNLSQLVPSAPGGLVGAAARDKVSLPIPAIPKRAVPAEVITRVQPVYSEIARRSRTTGTVVLDIAIDDQGKVTHATAVSGPAILRQAAVDAVLRWRFRPATLDGKSVTSTSQVTIVFK